MKTTNNNTATTNPLLDVLSNMDEAPEGFRERALELVTPGLEGYEVMVVRTVTEADGMPVRVQYDVYLTAKDALSLNVYATATNTADENGIARCRIVSGAGTPGSLPKGGVWSNTMLPTHKHYRIAELDALARASLLDVLTSRGEACWAALLDRQTKAIAYAARQAARERMLSVPAIALGSPGDGTGIPGRDERLAHPEEDAEEGGLNTPE